MSPAIALLMVKVPVGFGNTVRLHKGIGRQAVGVLARLSHPVAHKFRVDARVNDKMRHVDVFGPNSRAIDCAKPRSAILPEAKAAYPELPRTEAVAPVKKIEPFCRSTMYFAASRPERNAP